MTCMFCNYDFCYYCGAEAGNGSSHWAPGMGCGVGMMDGDGGTVRKPCCQLICKILRIIGMILAYPIAVVLAPAIGLTAVMLYGAFKEHWALGVYCIFMTPFTIALGLVFDICWSPVAIIMLPTLFMLLIMDNCRRSIKGRRKAMKRIQDIVENNKVLYNNR